MYVVQFPQTPFSCWLVSWCFAKYEKIKLKEEVNENPFISKGKRNFIINSNNLCSFSVSVGFDYRKGAAICLCYLNELCEDEDRCALQHPKSRLPYKWQYQKNNEVWKTFKNDLNDAIEKSFCDPTQTKLKWDFFISDINSLSF